MPPVPSLLRRAPRNLVALFRRPPSDDLAGPISAFESETQAVFVRTTPYSEHAILHVLTAIIVILIFLMAVVKLDRVVTSTGQLVPTRGNIFIQPLQLSMIKAIRVHPGEIVKKGQVLAELDPTFAQADVDQYKEHLALDTALVARLEAEAAGKPYVPGPTKPEQLQYSIWAPRQQEYEHMVRDFDERISSDQATIVKAQKDIVNYAQRSGIAVKIEGMETELENKGYGSKMKVLLSKDQRVEIDRLLEETRNVLSGAEHDIASLKAQRQQAIGKWNDDLNTQLSAARDDLDKTAQTLTKAQKVSELNSIVAPEDAIVLDVANASVNTVVDPQTQTGNGKPLFTLTPLNGPVEAEVHISTDDIGFTDVGDVVQIKLDAYPYMRHGTMKGRITTISEGSFTTDVNNVPTAPYFKARVRVESTDLHNVPSNFRLIPGSTLQGDVMVGRRTMLSYLVEGALRSSHEAMREP